MNILKKYQISPITLFHSYTKNIQSLKNIFF